MQSFFISVLFSLSCSVLILALYTNHLAIITKKNKLRELLNGSKNESCHHKKKILADFDEKYFICPEPIAVTPTQQRKVSRISSMAQKQIVQDIHEVKEMIHSLHQPHWKS